MATMYPQEFPKVDSGEDPRRTSAERRVYNALKTLPNEYTVLWNAKWVEKQLRLPAEDREADFLIMSPRGGLIIVEVKGGGISFDPRARTWVSTDRYGERHTIDPFNQVERQYRSLRRKLKEDRDTSRYVYPIARAVWFTELSKRSAELSAILDARGGLSAAAPRDMILDRHDLADPETGLSRVRRYWRGDAGYKAAASTNEAPLSPRAIDAVVQFLASKFTIPIRLVDEFGQEQQLAAELTKDQYQVLEELKGEQRACISGIAGSGKTMLAKQKAKDLAQEGFDVLLTCYNPHLAADLADEFRANTRVTVCAFSELCEQYAMAAGVDTTPFHTEDDYRELRLPNLLLEALSVVHGRFDAIIVDEGQDFSEDAWVSLQFLLREVGSGVFYIFYDDNQKIYRRGSLKFPFNEPTHLLSINCRNTKRIHKDMLAYCRTNRQLDCKGAEGRDIHRVPCTPWDVQQKVADVLDHLLTSEGIRAADIVILTPVAEGSQWHEGMKLGKCIVTWNRQLTGRNRIQCSSIQDFKGLERPLIMLTEMDKATRDQEKLQYIARSRARNHLVVFETT